MKPLFAFPVAVFGITAAAAAATTAPTTHPGSPDLLPGGDVTFRFEAPAARTVSVGGSVVGRMHRNSAGVWSLTIGPLPPNVYYYHYLLDGASFADPENPWNHDGGNSLLLIPSPADELPRPWEAAAVPHGSVQIDYYSSTALGGRLRRCHVYTPPGYGQGVGTYPTLYLLHGHGDDDAGWTNIGRANFMLDSLIAAGRAAPMVVVMPDGGSLDTMATADFVNDVLNDLLPFVESRYRIRRDAAGRAVAGLSMGGGHAMHLALDHPTAFGAVGIWSAGWRDWEKSEWRKTLPKLQGPSAAFTSLQTIDLSCGQDDRLLPLTESLDAWLARCDLPHTTEITAGSHAWPVWRAALLRFLPRLFRPLPAAP